MKEEVKCVPDLAKERASSRFSAEEITLIMDGGAEQTTLRKNLEEYFLSNPAFVDSVPPEYLSHSERYSNELRKACALVHCLNQDPRVQNIVGQMEGIRMLMGSGLGMALTKDGNPLALHYIMFLPALVSQATQEQLAHWMGRAWSGDIIGTYAQTELGHGTFLRGLETTATYDSASKEFVLHSPTVSSTKWWPGGLGKTANFAVVMAQLYTQGQCHGPHPFVVELRDTDTHKSLPGISVGEIGPRLGMNTNDNGYLRMNQVRIPRDHMLMQHAQVTESGSYIKPASSKLAYGTMVFVRVAICFDAGRQLQRAVTIATRYAAVRRQGLIDPREGEVQILDYQTQQDKLLPQISLVFAGLFAARRIWDTYNAVTQNVDNGDFSMLPELHALSCGLKASLSRDCSNGCDICRIACGGHGYLASSNLPRISTTTTASQTYEGENTVMWLQVARYLHKNLRESREGGVLPPSVQFLAKPPSPSSDRDRLSNEGLVRGWQCSCVHQLTAVEDRMGRLMTPAGGGLTPDNARNACALMLVKAAECYTLSYISSQFHTAVHQLPSSVSAGTVGVLEQLCRLHVLHSTLHHSALLLRSGWVTAAEVTALEEEYCGLLAALRPEAVNLVDAFDIHDRILDSTLGYWDGRVYDRLMEEALKSPLNSQDVPDAYHKYLKPLLKANL